MNKIKVISELKQIVSKKYNSMEAINLLREGIFTFENKMYYSTLSIYSIFIEKYLRDKLIEKENWWINIETFEKYDENEKNIEDELNRKWQKKKWLSFYEIIEKLFWIESSEYKVLKDFYEHKRNLILHWLFSRLAFNLGLNKNKIVDITQNWRNISCKLNQSSALTRQPRLYKLLEKEVITTSEVIINIINIFEKK